MGRRGELRAATAQLSARSLAILVLLVSLSAQHLIAQAGTQPAHGSFAPSGNLSLSPAPSLEVSLAIRCENSAVALVLADPENRRLGSDPRHHQAYDEIPGASIDSAGREDGESGAPEDPSEVIHIVNPQPGRYTLTLIGARDGTYSCWISATLGNGASAKISLRNKPLELDQVERVAFTLQPKANSLLVPVDSALARP